MKIRFHKLTSDRHALEIERDDRSRERVELETRSFFLHDLLHLAVESEARLERGFWGNLARGKTLRDMNDRTGASMVDAAPQMAIIEKVVGALTSAAKGMPAEAMVAGLQRYAEATESPFPDWITQAFIEAVQERMRKLQGHWHATPFGSVMEVVFAVDAPPAELRRASEDDAPVLWRMLTYAAWMDPAGRDNVAEARRDYDLRGYVEGWMRDTDLGVVASDKMGVPVGAAWVRLVAGDSPHKVSTSTEPELAIGIEPSARGQGLGTRLLTSLFEHARGRYPAIVLSVREQNPSKRLYERMGFVTTGTVINRAGSLSYTMRRAL